MNIQRTSIEILFLRRRPNQYLLVYNAKVVYVEPHRIFQLESDLQPNQKNVQRKHLNHQTKLVIQRYISFGAIISITDTDLSCTATAPSD